MNNVSVEERDQLDVIWHKYFMVYLSVNIVLIPFAAYLFFAVFSFPVATAHFFFVPIAMALNLLVAAVIALLIQQGTLFLAKTIYVKNHSEILKYNQHFLNIWN